MINKAIKILQRNYVDYVFYCLFFAYCMYVSLSVGYWYDELSWTLKYVHQTTFFEMLYNLTTKIYNLPLYYVVLYPFYMISDNAHWLRLPSIIATMGTIYYIQKFICTYYGKTYKIVVWLLFLCSPTVLFIALRVRPYAFMLFFSAYSLYLYYQRLENFNITNIIKYGISITFLAYSHWYGGLLIASYGLLDLYQFLKKKLEIKFIISYFICFFLFIPWLGLMIANHEYDFFSYWGRHQSYFYIVHILYCIAGVKIICILTMFSFSMMISRDKVKNFYIAPHILSIFSIFFIWSIAWLYSVINPDGSVIEIRYFFVFIPQWIVLLIAFVTKINRQNIKHICKKLNNKLLTTIVICVMLCSYAMYNYLSFSPKELKYEFSGYKELLEACQKDMEKHKVLVWFYDQKFLNVYDALDNMDIVSYMTYNNYNAVFFKKYKKIQDKNKYFNTLNKLNTMTCDSGIRYLLDANKIKLYNNYVQGKDNTSLTDFNVCDYDIIYLENKTMMVTYVRFFLEKYYDIYDIRLNGEQENYIFRLVRKEGMSL